MPNYTEFMMRHGEFGVQALLEQIERQEGVVISQDNLSLEQRWETLMREASMQQRQAA